jgi:hypothetical protein
MTTTVETNTAGQVLGWNQPPAITWSFATSNIPDDGIRLAPPYSAFADNPSAQMTYMPFVNVAFSVWSAIADVQFQQVPDGPGADIRIGFGDLLPSSIGKVWYEWQGDTFVPGTVLQVENPQHTPLQNTDLGPGYVGYQTLLLQDLIAQIGHAIGLGNSIDDPNSIGYPVLGLNNLLPDSNDIAAIQSIYGPPPPTPPAPVWDIPPGVTTAPKPPSAPPPPWTKNYPLLNIKSGAIALPESALAVQSDDSQGPVTLEDITKGLVSGDNTMAFLAADPANPVDPPPGIDWAPMVRADLYAPPPTGSAVVPDVTVCVSMADPGTLDPPMMVAGLQCQAS